MAIDIEKEKLLAQLQSLGYHPSGRKIRNDKNSAHNTHSRTNTALSTYLRVKSRMYNRDAYLQANGDTGTMLEVDENSFYVTIPARYDTKGKIYYQIVNGRKIEHTVQRVKVQKEIDLESYRFEAYKEQAITNPDLAVDNRFWPELRQMLNIRFGLTGDEATKALTKRQITWFELFCEFYYLLPQEAWHWTYDLWRMYYEYIPKQLLPEDFTLSLIHPPGSPEFHPEWTWKRMEKIQQKLDEVEQEKKRKSEQFIINLKRRKNYE